MNERDKLKELLKAKYISRKKGKGGKWEYEYAEPKGQERKSKEGEKRPIDTREFQRYLSTEKRINTAKEQMDIHYGRDLSEYKRYEKLAEGLDKQLVDQVNAAAKSYNISKEEFIHHLEKYENRKKSSTNKATDRLSSLLKAKYTKRVPKAGGGYRYYYAKDKGKEKKEVDTKDTGLGNMNHPVSLTDQQIVNNIKEAVKMPLKKLRKNQGMIDTQLEMAHKQGKPANTFQKLNTMREIYTAAVDIKEFGDATPEDWIDNVRNQSRESKSTMKSVILHSRSLLKGIQIEPWQFSLLKLDNRRN